MSDPWIICPVCEGEGKHVNPNIDANGLSDDDFHDDPDFVEDYLSGVYDVGCNKCGGSGKMKASAVTAMYERHAEDAAARRLAAMENGDFEAYCGAGDWRW